MGFPINTYNEWIIDILSIIYIIIDKILESSYLLVIDSIWISLLSFLSDGIWILLLEVDIIGWKLEMD
jgi:hypothetical protein